MTPVPTLGSYHNSGVVISGARLINVLTAYRDHSGDPVEIAALDQKIRELRDLLVPQPHPLEER